MWRKMWVAGLTLALLGCGKAVQEEARTGKEKAPIEEVLGIKRVLTKDSDAATRRKVATENKDVQLDLGGVEKAVIHTSKGDIEVELYAEDAPVTVNNFVRLSLLGFYDGLTFHRYVPDFVIQGGDPLGNGTGDAGYNIPLEVSSKRHVEGALGMARAADPNSGSCQFYITLRPTPHLDGSYTVFGKVVKGMDVVKALRKGDIINRIDIILTQSKAQKPPTQSGE